MAIDFPTSPTVGQIFTGGGATWVWDGVKWTSSGGGGATPSTALPKMAGVAAAGLASPYSREDHIHPVDTSRLALAGGTVTGPVTFTGAPVTISLPSGATNAQRPHLDGPAGTGRTVMGSTAGVDRWALALGNGVAEGGSNAGSDFAVSAFSDAGASLFTAFQITRATGNATFSGIVTINGGSASISGAAGTARQLGGYTGVTARWGLILGNVTAEGGSNTGSDFSLNSYTDAGALLSSPLIVNRATGMAAFAVAPSFPLTGPLYGNGAGALTVATAAQARTASAAAGLVGLLASATVNFNALGDTAIPIPLPAGYTRYFVGAVRVTGASATISVAKLGIYTQPSQGGFAQVAPVAVVISTIAADTVGNMASPGPIVSTGTIALDVANLYANISVVQGSAVTATVTIQYTCLP
jgi:hypothetical protein